MLPLRIMPALLLATWRPITADGIPVRGGAGAITVPPGLVRWVEIACGGATRSRCRTRWRTGGTGRPAASPRRATRWPVSRCSRR